ncbi:thermostable hemolysin [Glaciecola sp. XM2]|jgi:hypothetical protein|uniref:thermostable hemolysin n=1 Tax=Glaciecola sp. XM2 TaxID=1914931 RepID=UPI001BDE7548|nr:thermostable hemolysin [Glaciecola sp. XM2]MBT1449295.1 thermostable hemolysin [Glaciecola sp. XM2]
MQTILRNISDSQSTEQYAASCVHQHSKKYAFDIDLFALNDDGRHEAQHFIKSGYLKAYNANIEVTSPWLLAINNGQYKAALGIRPAIETLFLEQYLSLPVEQVLSLHNKVAMRSEIAEISNLYSNANKFTIPLFLTTAVSLYCNQYTYMVFSATEHVLTLISKTGISHTLLGKADESLLLHSTNDWGTYYSTNPKVVSLNLLEVMSVISSSKLFMNMFSGLEPRIALAATKIGTTPV